MWFTVGGGLMCCLSGHSLVLLWGRSCGVDGAVLVTTLSLDLLDEMLSQPLARNPLCGC